MLLSSALLEASLDARGPVGGRRQETRYLLPSFLRSKFSSLKSLGLTTDWCGYFVITVTLFLVSRCWALRWVSASICQHMPRNLCTIKEGPDSFVVPCSWQSAVVAEGMLGVGELNSPFLMSMPRRSKQLGPESKQGLRSSLVIRRLTSRREPSHPLPWAAGGRSLVGR